MGEILGLDLFSGTVANIFGSDGLNIYYDALLAGNSYLAGLDYNFTDGGMLIAMGGEPVPEPATMLLLGSGLMGLAGLRRKKPKR